MSYLEILALSLSLTGLLLLGSSKPLRIVQGFLVNILGCVVWIIAIPKLSIVLVNCMFITINLINIYRTKLPKEIINENPN